MSEAPEDVTRPHRKGPIKTVVGLGAAWRKLRPFFRGTGLSLALLVVVSIITGLVEASLLALIATMAVSLAEGGSHIPIQFGPRTVEAARDTTFAVAVALALARAGLQVLLAYLPAQMSARVLTDLRIELFEAFTASSWSVKAQERDGAFQTLMTQNITRTSQTVINLGLGLTAGVMFLTMTAGAFLQSFVAAAVFLVAALALFFLLRPLSRRLRSHATQLSKEAMSFTNSVQEVVQLAEETEVFGATKSYRQRFRDEAEAVRRPYSRTRFLAVGVPSLYQSVALLLLVVALIGISLTGTAELSSLAAVILMLIRALSYAQQLQTSLSAIDERLPFMYQLANAFERYRANTQQNGPGRLDDVDTLELSGVSFGYQPRHDVLHGVSFEVKRGQALGIVGPSGAGKSSLVQILLRLRDPHTGAVRVNGSDVREVRRADWQARVAYVPQASQVVWGTVRDNIRFRREWISDEEVIAAAEKAHLHHDILSWPEGYDTHIGQRSNAVSGGQRQRICLARALAGQPQVLVLDEPTSALDVRSEELVQESLAKIKSEIITILVAHRLSTLSVCDTVVVMIDGRVSAIGSHADLMEQSDFFREVHAITKRQSGT